MVSFERVFEVLDAPLPLVDRPGAVDLVAPRGRIEVDAVRFTYPDKVIVPTLELDPTVGLVVQRNGEVADADPSGDGGAHGRPGDGSSPATAPEPESAAAPAREVLQGVTATVEPGSRGVGRAVGRRQTTGRCDPRYTSRGGHRLTANVGTPQDSLHAHGGRRSQHPIHTRRQKPAYARRRPRRELVAPPAPQNHTSSPGASGYDTWWARVLPPVGGAEQRWPSKQLLKDRRRHMDEAPASLTRNEAPANGRWTRRVGHPS